MYNFGSCCNEHGMEQDNVCTILLRVVRDVAWSRLVYVQTF